MLHVSSFGPDSHHWAYQNVTDVRGACGPVYYFKSVHLCNCKCMLAKCCLTVTMVSNLLYLSPVSFPYLFVVCAFHMNTVSAWLHVP